MAELRCLKKYTRYGTCSAAIRASKKSSPRSHQKTIRDPRITRIKRMKMIHEELSDRIIGLEWMCSTSQDRAWMIPRLRDYERAL